MNEKRKKIIIAEIKYWKQSKLLPEHYCDFLVTLYSRGDELVDKEIKVSNSIGVKENRKRNRMILLLIFLAVICGVSLILLDTYPIITFGIPALIICFQLLYAMSKTVEKSQITPFLYISSAFILLAMSLKLWTVFFEDQTLLLIGLLMINCVLWLFTGRLVNLLYFTISGVVGLLLIIGYVIAQF